MLPVASGNKRPLNVILDAEHMLAVVCGYYVYTNKDDGSAEKTGKVQRCKLFKPIVTSWAQDERRWIGKPQGRKKAGIDEALRVFLRE
jgi:hypothetical protein